MAIVGNLMQVLINGVIELRPYTIVHWLGVVQYKPDLRSNEICQYAIGDNVPRIFKTEEQ